MNKFLASLSLTAALSMSIVPALAHGNTTSFKGQQIKIHFENKGNVTLTDIKGHWADKYIQDLVNKGVLSGDDKHHFSPEASVSRAQWAVMVSRYFDLTSTATTQDFTDVPTGSWAYPYVEASKNYFDAFKSVNGSLQFHPNTAATRQDVTVTLVKVLEKLDPSVTTMDATAADTLLKSQFSDYNLINANLRPYVATAVQNNLIHGDGKGHFMPLKPLSRAQAATMLDLLISTGIVVPSDAPTNTTTGTDTGTTTGTDTGATTTTTGTTDTTTGTTTTTTTTDTSNTNTTSSGSTSTTATE